MECFDKGILTLEDTGGIELRFGDADALLACLRLIADRRGLGDMLAEGSRRASEIVGQAPTTGPCTSKGWRCRVTSLEASRRWRWGWR